MSQTNTIKIWRAYDFWKFDRPYHHCWLSLTSILLIPYKNLENDFDNSFSKFGRHKTQESGVLRCPSYSKTSKGIIKELKGTSWNS